MRYAAIGLIAAAMACGWWLAPGHAEDVDINTVFWCQDGQDGGLSPEQCADARGLILQNCTSCHTFVPVVKAQKSPAEWAATMLAHRDRMPDVPDDQYDAIRTYLTAHFNPGHPPPKLPPELEKLGTSQAL